jgi:hypothetical protein
MFLIFNYPLPNSPNLWSPNNMDVSTMDNATARTAILLEIQDLIGYMYDNIHVSREQIQGLRRYRRSLQNQLFDLTAQEIQRLHDRLTRRTAIYSAAGAYDNEDSNQEQRDTESVAHDGAISIHPTVECDTLIHPVPRSNTVRLDGGHVCCYECMIMHVETALYQDTPLFPPKCCHIPLPLYIHYDHITPERRAEFDLRVERLTSSNPTDCHHCTRFISSINTRGNVVLCPECNRNTCITCKKGEHAGLCKEDPNDMLLRNMARDQGWAERGRCHIMVERTGGCYHIT